MSKFTNLLELKNCVGNKLKNDITPELIQSLRTQQGNTQSSERATISLVKKTLDELGLKYSQAGSQQPVDFRNIHDPTNVEIKFDLEVKKNRFFQYYVQQYLSL